MSFTCLFFLTLIPSHSFVLIVFTIRVLFMMPNVPEVILSYCTYVVSATWLASHFPRYQFYFLLPDSFLYIFFQGMKLLPTGRKSSLAIFAYSSVVSIHLTIVNVFFSDFNVTLLDHTFMMISQKNRLAWRHFFCTICRDYCVQCLWKLELPKTCIILYVSSPFRNIIYGSLCMFNSHLSSHLPHGRK